jgi:hypothetical protein
VNREQRRDSMRNDERLVVDKILVMFTNGVQLELDTAKIMIIDKETKAQLFDFVLDQEEKKQ